MFQSDEAVPSVDLAPRRRRRVTVSLLATAIAVAAIAATAMAPQARAASLCDPPTTGPGKLSESTGTAEMTISEVAPEDCRRTYRLDSSFAVNRTFTEVAGRPVLRTGSALLDGLFAMAVDDARLNEVAQVTNGDYNSGKPIECKGGCYQTGEFWTYVWTRDVSYSADLALASLDPSRMRNTLLFKLSDRRGADGGSRDTQIIQDTGTGGSYPNSTDRVVWAQAAGELLDWLPDGARQDFAARAYPAIRNTVEHDRRVVYDKTTGLYHGEQSFLDWREQTYPAWTRDDVANIATSQALSTNVTHWMALDAAANLGKIAGDGKADEYRNWAGQLVEAIRNRLWLPEQGAFSQMLATRLDPSPVLRYDALGTALAVVTGIATPDQARKAVANYPQSPFGPPVNAPQTKDIGAYHNLGSWPFVTAYLARAGAATRNDGVATASARSLIRSAALFGSNMENVNMIDGSDNTSINSKRQLWSIAGMLSLLQHTTFGVDARPDGLHVNPFLPAQLRHEYFPKSGEITLSGINYRGRTLTVTLRLPVDSDQPGAYRVQEMSLDGRSLAPGTAITGSMLTGDSTLTVTLGDPTASVAAAPMINLSDPEAVYAPAPPAITHVAPNASGDRLVVGVNLNGADAARVRMDVLRDGAVIAADVPAATSWQDRGSEALDRQSYCYSARLRYSSTGNTSHHAKPVCFWKTDFSRVQKRLGSDFEAVGGKRTTKGGGTYYRDWGTGADDSLTARFEPAVTGRYLFQVQAAVGNAVGSGVASGIKLVRITEDGTDNVVAEETVVMPNTGNWSTIRDSTFVDVHLTKGRTYRAKLMNDPLAVNMSYFEHNARYDATRSGPYNNSDVYAMQIMLKSADGAARKPAEIRAG